MDRLELLPMELPSAVSINGGGKGRMPFVRRLALGCVVLACLGLLYVPAYHSAQGPLLGIGDASTIGASGGSRFPSSMAQLPGWGFNTSRNLNSYIFPDTNTTILSPGDTCAPYLLIVVCSAVGNLQSRMAIRSTWANASYFGRTFEETIKVAFILGQSDNETLNSSIVEESLRYTDIIVEKFHDTYNNLTLKSVMMLKWVVTNCEKATYVMKTDDDMFVNVDTLLRSLRARPNPRGTLIGSLICNAKPISDPKNKWYTPKYIFSEKTYPNYLSGTGYVMSMDVASKLYKVALQTPLLHLEDVYITGVCAKYARLRPSNHPGFSYVPRKLDVCTFKNAITAHKVNTSVMHTMWNKLMDNYNASCPENKSTKKMPRSSGFYLVNLTKRKNISRCV